jgi:hypothetical protein
MKIIASAIVMLLMGAVWLIYFGGGLALAGVFIYGIYVLFAKSIGFGLMLIGASVVGGWLLMIVFGLLMAAAMTAVAGITAALGVVDRWNDNES